MKRTLLATAALLIAAAPVMAQQVSGNSASKTSGLYGVLDLGNSKVDLAGNKSNRTSVGIALGHDINENLAVEAGLRRIGGQDTGGDSNTLMAAQVSVLGKLPLSTQATAFVRAGLSSNSMESRNQGVSQSFTRNQPLLGVGLDYALDSKWGVRAEYTDMGKFAAVRNGTRYDVKAQQFNVGATMKF